MVWNIEIQRRAALLASAIFACVVLGGCVDDSSQTELNWGDVNDVAVRPHTDYVAPQTHVARRAPEQTVALDCPAPRAKPAWYTANNLPPPSVPTLQPAVTYAGAPAFSWPVHGAVISDFGSNGNGQRNDGINIAAALGTPIRAAAAGTISYAGNELRGYGNLILIRHDDGYVTAYAHAERIVVARGETVVRGQVIAYAGSSGDVTSPQLHFEIRHGVQPLNPRTLLTSPNAS